MKMKKRRKIFAFGEQGIFVLKRSKKIISLLKLANQALNITL
jgi:hypothetical protein